jgi:probable F420-dependent oxidoreductase
MRIETYIPGLSKNTMDIVKHAESLGYDALVSGELNNEPFLPVLVGLEHTNLIVRTGLAIAFPRSPMTVANMGWDLQSFSNGRFQLGLGTQVKGHNERRFSVPWSPPAPRMREYVQAVKAIWNCWKNGEKLDFKGDHYTHTLMTPMFTPPPMDANLPPIYVSGLGPGMARIAGEVADGLLLHPMCSLPYIKEIILPAVKEGAAKANRDPKECELLWGGFIATGETEEELAKAKRDIAARISFYASTRTYKPALDFHGWGDVNTQLHELSIAGEWQKMFDLVSDEMVETLGFCGSGKEVANNLRDELSPICSAAMWNEIEHLGTDHSQDERMHDLIKIVKA